MKKNMSIYFITNVSHNQIINILNKYQSLFPNFLGDVFILSSQHKGVTRTRIHHKTARLHKWQLLQPSNQSSDIPNQDYCSGFFNILSLQRNTNRHTYPNTFLIIAKKYQWTLNANKKSTLKKVISLLCKQEWWKV